MTETEKVGGGECKCLHPSAIYWSYKYPSGIHRSGTFESSAIWSRAHCSRLALNSHAEPQVPDCMSNFNSSEWISEKKNQISALRDGAAAQFRGQQCKQQKQARRDGHTHKWGKQRGHCVSDWPGLFTILVSMRTPGRSERTGGNLKEQQQHVLLAFTTRLYMHAAQTQCCEWSDTLPAHPSCLSVCHCCSDGIPEAPLGAA